MNFKIFYSWQSDLPSSENRSAIEKALEAAIKGLNKEHIELEIVVDRDTKNTSGTPDIIATIFDKISTSQIFVGDISIINSESNEKRKCPNPNVLLELGFAAGKLKWDKIICVFNKAYGEPEDLPFDLRFRRPLMYDSKNEKKDISNLSGVLKKAISSIIEDYKKQNTIYFGRSHGRLCHEIDLIDSKKIIKSLNKNIILKEGKNEVKVNVPIVPALSLDKHVYFATPSRLGKVKAGVSNIDGGFVKVGEKIRIDEAPFGKTEFDLYCSSNALNGSVDFHIRFDDLDK
jgi:hypothetical protein